MELDCPTFGSENSQKLSLAVEGGTFSTSSFTLGIGATNNGAGVLGASSKGASTSKTAEKFAAPYKMPAIRGFIAITIFAGLAALFLGSFAITIGFWVGVVAAIFSVFYNFKIFPQEFAEWDSKYLSLRCSEVFVPQTRLDGEE